MPYFFNRFSNVAKEITHAATQSVYEYIWHVKGDQRQRNGRLGKSNLHPTDRESCLTSQLPTRWRAGKLLHCMIDPDVAFWYGDLKSCLNARKTGVCEKSRSDAGQETNWGEGLLEDCCRKRDIFQRRKSAFHFLLRRN